MTYFGDVYVRLCSGVQPSWYIPCLDINNDAYIINSPVNSFVAATIQKSQSQAHAKPLHLC